VCSHRTIPDDYIQRHYTLHSRAQSWTQRYALCFSFFVFSGCEGCGSGTGKVEAQRHIGHIAPARMRISSKPTLRLRHDTSLLASDDDITSRFRAAHGNYINTSPPAPQLTS
jgi:hypothetical protein